MTNPRPLPPLPDPHRFGGPGWLERTGGVMTRSQCLHGVGLAAVQQVRNLWERLTPALWRVGNLDGLAGVPDSRLIRLAEEAALDQGSVLLAHGYRSALFGRALAHIDGIPADPELLHICGLLHDVGIIQAITGEDFTQRSAAVARHCAEAAGEAGAGAVILKMLERAELRDHVVVVTRWYGGVHLGGDRFAHVVTCVRAYLDALGRTG